MQNKIVRFGFVGVALAAMLVSLPVLAEDYSDPGTRTYTTTNLAKGFLGSQGGKLVVPTSTNATERFPLVVLSHGQGASAANMMGWASLLASRGFVVAIPSFPAGFLGLAPDNAKCYGIARAFLDYYKTHAKVDATRIAVMGHSGGGGYSVRLASERAADVDVVILFDPYNASDYGKNYLPTLTVPVLTVLAGRHSMCNGQGSWDAFKTAGKGQRVVFDVIGSTHCDGENPARSICTTACGAPNALRQDEYAHYGVAQALAVLKDDDAAAGELELDMLLANPYINAVQVLPAL